MNNVNAITRDDLIARLGAAVGLLNAIHSTPDGTWYKDSMIRSFLDQVFKPSTVPDCCPVVGGSCADEVTKK